VEKFSDFSSAEETDTDIPVNTDVLKLFDSENEMEESFLGESTRALNFFIL
jgi:hypothetical protein